ncbi:molybdopterin-guanine dinucleotide biosynthesis protein B [Paenibacillus wynnii]|uniref:molybdopterin-guanine dinucleotide biosynthesis protein B n=1 Tax=Paenibacillus wynnii TaxID=268407 RepID=UPI002792ABC1|nr:molybdopterin-guanine dinucleotide biosynthesis protein B [Paenibacillus wynnii]MDQ0194249.1 molybdopterin-guanine dinucleotide biosynthesis protein B [Paenibacillus wynnii]
MRKRKATRGRGIRRIHQAPETPHTTSIWQIVGYKNSGKTTLVCALIERLRHHGYTVAVIKHDHHGFEIDHPHTDTWRQREAGASAVAITNSMRTARIEEQGSGLQELVESFQSYDYILVEGFKNENYPKLVLIHEKEGLELLSLTAVSAVVVWESMWSSVDLLRPSEMPQYDINDISAIALHLNRQRDI